MCCENPRVCICVPAYNSEKTIERTLLSLVNQSYKNIVIFVIDNNSSDNTVAIARRISDVYRNVKVFEHDVTVPPAENFDRCISYSVGDFLCIFHSDDVYKKTIIEEEVAFFLLDKELGAVFTFGDIIDENDNIISESKASDAFFSSNIYTFEEMFPLLITEGNPFMTPTAMVKCDIYKNEIVKHNRNDLFYGAFDLDVWVRVLRNHKVGIIRKNLIMYRMGTNSYTFRHLLDYRNSIQEGAMNVLAQTIDEVDYKNKKYISLFKNRQMEIHLQNALKAYVVGDFEGARNLLDIIDLNGIKFRLKYKFWIYKVVSMIRLPRAIRIDMAYKKLRIPFKIDDECIK